MADLQRLCLAEVWINLETYIRKSNSNTLQHKARWKTTGIWKTKEWTPWLLRYGLKLQQCDLQSRSLSALMITRDSFSASVYFTGNKSVLLMLGAHLISICKCFIITTLERSSVFLDYLQPVDIYPWLHRARLCQKATVAIILLCSFRVRQLSVFCLQESLYLSTRQSNFPQSSRGTWKTQFEKKEEKRAYSYNHFNYSFQENCQQMLFFVCSVYFTVSHPQASLLLCMTREMTISGRDNIVYTNNWFDLIMEIKEIINVSFW